MSSAGKTIHGVMIMSTQLNNKQEYTFEITKRRINIMVSVCTVVALLLFLVPFLFIWGSQLSAPSIYGVGLLLVAFWLGMIAHEVIHALGWMAWGKVAWKQLRFGLDLSKGVAYAHSKVPMDIRGYKIGLVLPWIVLGVIPAMIGVVVGSGYLLAYGIIFFGASCGDLLLLWHARKLSSGTYVLDHPSDMGFYIVDQDYEVTDLDGDNNFREFIVGCLKPLGKASGFLLAGYLLGYGVGRLIGWLVR